MSDAPRKKELSRFYDHGGVLVYDRVSLRTEGAVCKPSGFAEYDNLTGYVEQTYTREWTDAAGNRWRKVVTVINLGRPDRGIPVDPDAQMQAERFPRHEPRPRKERRPTSLKRGDVQRQVGDYLRQYGPAHAKLIASDLGIAYDTLFYHLKGRKGQLYCACGKVGKAVIWGLVGVHDEEAA